MYRREEIIKEANAYFERNSAGIARGDCSRGMKIFCDFYDRCSPDIRVENMLEVGCSSGFNLFYMYRRYGIKGYGVDPSDKAVSFGQGIVGGGQDGVYLQQGFSDELPYGPGCFDLVYLGFCLYQVSRDLLLKTIAEADRVLKWGVF